jgi:hypothetical protein
MPNNEAVGSVDVASELPRPRTVRLLKAPSGEHMHEDAEQGSVSSGPEAHSLGATTAVLDRLMREP